MPALTYAHTHTHTHTNTDTHRAASTLPFLPIMICILSNQRFALARLAPPPWRVSSIVSVCVRGASSSRASTRIALRMVSMDFALTELYARV
jgi:hypothetical protein